LTPGVESGVETATATRQEVAGMMTMVGKPAPDFEADAFADGAFTKVRLSDYRGQWVTLCFYPGDFTFV
jgi:peroxiredoxin